LGKIWCLSTKCLRTSPLEFLALFAQDNPLPDRDAALEQKSSTV
jgi:hypothetical protein